MYGIVNYMAFVGVTIIFTLTPGIDSIFVINKSIAQGRRAGLLTVSGIGVGILLQTLIAAFGLSAILETSPALFKVIQYCGAGFMAWLGYKALVRKPVAKASQVKEGGRNDFTSGLVINMLNPKMPLFFIALFTQFISPESVSSPVPFLILGLTLTVIGCAWLVLLACFSGSLSAKFQNSPRASNIMNKVTGSVFLVLSAFMFLAGSPSSAD